MGFWKSVWNVVSWPFRAIYSSFYGPNDFTGVNKIDKEKGLIEQEQKKEDIELVGMSEKK